MKLFRTTRGIYNALFPLVVQKATIMGGVIGLMGSLVLYAAIRSVPQTADPLFVLDLVILLTGPTFLVYRLFGWTLSVGSLDTLFVVLLVNSLLVAFLGAGIAHLVRSIRSSQDHSRRHGTSVKLQ
jgi:hypothetical protein